MIKYKTEHDQKKVRDGIVELALQTLVGIFRRCALLGVHMWPYPGPVMQVSVDIGASIS